MRIFNHWTTREVLDTLSKKEREFGLQETINYGTITRKYTERTNRRTGVTFVRSRYANSLWYRLPISNGKSRFSLASSGGKEVGAILKGKRMPCFIVLPRWRSGQESACQFRRHTFDPCVRKIPQRRKWQPTPVVLPGKSHGQRSLEGYSPWGHEEADTTEHTPRCTSVREGEGRDLFLHLLTQLPSRKNKHQNGCYNNRNKTCKVKCS